MLLVLLHLFEPAGLGLDGRVEPLVVVCGGLLACLGSHGLDLGGDRQRHVDDARAAVVSQPATRTITAVTNQTRCVICDGGRSSTTQMQRQRDGSRMRLSIPHSLTAIIPTYPPPVLNIRTPPIIAQIPLPDRPKPPQPTLTIPSLEHIYPSLSSPPRPSLSRSSSTPPRARLS